MIPGAAGLERDGKHPGGSGVTFTDREDRARLRSDAARLVPCDGRRTECGVWAFDNVPRWLPSSTWAIDAMFTDKRSPAPNRTPSGYLMDDGPGSSPVELPAIEK